MEALDLLHVHLAQIPGIIAKGKYQNPQEGFMQIIQQAPDVVFLDIEMPFYNGFDLLDCVKNLKKVPIIVFITGYDKYLPLVKTNNEVFILLKPIDPVLLTETINTIRYNFLNSQQDIDQLQETLSSIRQYQKLAVATQNGAVFIRYSDIVYLQADGNYTNIFTQDGLKTNSSFNLKKFQDKLDPTKFLRCHNSVIINTDYLTRIDKKTKHVF